MLAKLFTVTILTFKIFSLPEPRILMKTLSLGEQHSKTVSEYLGPRIPNAKNTDSNSLRSLSPFVCKYEKIERPDELLGAKSILFLMEVQAVFLKNTRRGPVTN